MELTIKPYNIAPDISYFLDCALECGHIPLDVYFWSKFFCPNIVNIIDNSENLSLLQSGNRLEKLYLDWQEKSSIQVQYICLLYAVKYFSIKRLLENTTPVICERKDNTFGAMFNHKEICYENENLIHYNYLNDFQKRTEHIFESYERIFYQWDYIKNAVNVNELKIEYITPQFNEFRISEYNEEFKIDKSKRKALKRSADLLDSVNGNGTTKLFLSGEKLIVEGSKYKFELTKTGSVSGSHGSCKTAIFDIHSNKYVADLCVYTENVTVLDHLASIVIHCKTGMEDLIIQESNLINVYEADLLPMDVKNEYLKRLENRFVFLEGKKSIDKFHNYHDKLVKKAHKNIMKKIVSKYNLNFKNTIEISNRSLIAIMP